MPPIIASIGTASKRGFLNKLNDFKSFTFTNAGVYGRFGPTLAQCQSSYSATSWASNTANFNMVTQGYQLWTVPVSGNYIIEAAGAKGGAVASNPGAAGAKITGTFSLTKGTVMSIVVGQIGISDLGGSQQCGGGGGGGTFVIKNGGSSEADIYVIAGGGGGGCGVASKTPIVGQSTTNGSNANPCGTYDGGALAAPGIGGGAAKGYGGTAGYGGGGGLGGGGGGFFNIGGIGGFSAGPGQGYLVGGAVGGTSQNTSRTSYYSGVYNGSGGFGGGGGASQDNGYGGGGGGYSGGGGGTYDGSMGSGGGGGSYNNGTNQTNLTGGNNSDGYVKITLI